MSAPPVVTIRRATAADDPVVLGAFFAANVHPAYISHGEVMGGSALDFAHWRSDLPEFAASGLRGTLTRDPQGQRECVYVALEAAALIGLSIVTFSLQAPSPYATLQDLVVAEDRRGSGVGKLLADRAADDARARGCVRLFLESGLQNHAAHRFFEREGFRRTSVVMVKELG